jgi:uncharacterized protein YdhG (YjbR/CyaY superfamily)
VRDHHVLEAPLVVTAVDDYINAQAPEVQARLRELREAIVAAAPDAEEVISYGMPTYKRGGQRIHFAAAARHAALYGAPTELFAEELKGLRQARGTIRFPLDRPIPRDIVGKLAAAKLGG